MVSHRATATSNLCNKQKRTLSKKQADPVISRVDLGIPVVQSNTLIGQSANLSGRDHVPKWWGVWHTGNDPVPPDHI